MYGISAPGALSFKPLPKHIKQALRRRYLFIGGLESVCMASAASSIFGEGGRLISSSFGVMGSWTPLGVKGVWAPVGVGDTWEPLQRLPQGRSSSSWVVCAAVEALEETGGGRGSVWNTADGPVTWGLSSILMKAPKGLCDGRDAMVVSEACCL